MVSTNMLAKLYRKQLAKVKLVGNYQNGFVLRKESDKVVFCLHTCSTMDFKVDYKLEGK